jgi:hypothetical protein
MLIALAALLFLPIPYLLMVGGEKLGKAKPEVHRALIVSMQVIAVIVLVLALMTKCSAPIDPGYRQPEW